MSEHLGRLLTAVHLHHAADALVPWLDRAAAQGLSHHDFLLGLLEEERVARMEAETGRRFQRAAFPFTASIEQFDFRARPELKRQVVLHYLDPTFVAQAVSLALIGPPGLGKTHSAHYPD
jgi:DNA replication protein DnaC